MSGLALRQVVMIVVAAAAMWSAGVSAMAQNKPADLDTLKKKLAALEEQVAAEEKAIKQAEADAANELRTLAERRAKLGEEAVSLQTELLTLRDRHEELVAATRRADAELKRVTDAHRTAQVAASTLTERLRIYLREIPAHDATRETLTKLLDTLAGQGAEADVAHGELAKIGESVNSEASTLRTRQTEVWTASGSKQTVTLMTAGHVAFAYRTADGRVGLALNSPADATGYRWTEDLQPQQAALVASAIDAAEAGGDRVLVPLDVSGQLRVDTVKTEQTFEEWFASGGPIMYALAGVAALAVLLILERAFVLYMLNGTNRAMVLRVMRAVRNNAFDEAESMSGSGRGAVARTLAACLERRGRSLHAMEDSVQEQLLHELPRLERFLGGIAILAAVAPLLGLLGTVTGIIQTFGVIRAFGNANPGAMAGGISEALVTTAAGLVIAIPILLLHGVLRGRVERIIAEAEKHAATLLNVVAHDTDTPLTAGAEAAGATNLDLSEEGG